MTDCGTLLARIAARALEDKPMLPLPSLPAALSADEIEAPILEA
jgi:hypothetical protein